MSKCHIVGIHMTQLICFTVEKSGTGIRQLINYMSHVAIKRFLGVRAHDAPAGVYVDTH